MIKTTTSQPETALSKLRGQPTILLNGLWIGLTLLPIILLAIELNSESLLVPYADEVVFIPYLAKLHTGGLTLNDLWVQHNEHRIVIWRLLALALAKAGGYSVPKETWASFGFALLTLIAIGRLLALSLQKQWLGPLTVVASWLIFSATQWQNWYWGFQLSWLLVNFMVVLAVLMLGYQPVKRLNFLIAVGLCGAATFTVGTAIPIWPAVAVGMLVYWNRWGWKYVGGWCLAAVVTFGVFSYDYNFTPPDFLKSDRGYALAHPLSFLAYILNYLGHPLAAQSQDFQGPLWSGLAIVAATALSFGWLVWRVRPDPLYRPLWEKSWPWLVLSLFAVFNAVLAAVSRVSSGVEEAFGSRYTSVATLLWLGGGMLTFLAVQHLYAVYLKSARLKLGLVGGSLLILLVLGGSFGVTYLKGWREWQTSSTYLNASLPFIYEYETAPVDMLIRLTFSRESVARGLFWTLSQYHEGPFQITKEQYQASQNSQWQKQIKEGGYSARAYPANLMVMVYGDGSSLKAEGERLSFQHSGADSTNVVLDLNKFYGANGLPNGSKPPMIEIQTETAQYVRVFSDTGHDFNYGEQTALAMALEPTNQHLFRLKLPEGTQRFRVDTLYQVSTPQPDSLKVTIYTAGS